MTILVLVQGNVIQSLIFQHRNCCTPSSCIFSGKRKGSNLRKLSENVVNHFSEDTSALAMNDTNLENALSHANSEIMRQEVFHIPWLKVVQVQQAVNR